MTDLPKSSQLGTYECKVNVEGIVAVDMHVHLEVNSCGHKSMPEDIMDASAKYFKSGERTPSVDTIAELYRGLKMAAVVFTIDARTQMGLLPNSIDDLVEGCQRNGCVL